MKVYVIRYEELYSNNSFSSGVSYVFDSLDKAKDMLKKIKEDEIEYYVDNGWNREDIDIKEELYTLYFDFFDEYTKYEIIEMEVN
jgi:hypothetical protein